MLVRSSRLIGGDLVWLLQHILIGCQAHSHCLSLVVTEQKGTLYDNDGATMERVAVAEFSWQSDVRHS